MIVNRAVASNPARRGVEMGVIALTIEANIIDK